LGVGFGGIKTDGDLAAANIVATSNLTVSGSIAGDGSGLENVSDPSSPSYRLTSASTVTVARVVGGKPYKEFDLYVTNDLPQIGFDLSSYSTNAGHVVSLALYIGTNAIVWDSASIATNDIYLLNLSTNTWNHLIFSKGPHQTNFYPVQVR